MQAPDVVRACATYPSAPNRSHWIGVMAKCPLKPTFQVWILKEPKMELVLDGEFADHVTSLGAEYWWLIKRWIPKDFGNYLAIIFCYVRDTAPPIPDIRLLFFRIFTSAPELPYYSFQCQSKLFVEQRFENFSLKELITPEAGMVKDFAASAMSPRQIADNVIIGLEYPLPSGKPDDYHRLQYFRGEYELTREFADYWQKPSETLRTRVGDCEDGAILCTSAYRAYGLSAEDVYCILGVVKDEKGNVLGGHGWTYARWSEEGFRLIETTLDTPPADYPISGKTLEDIKKPFKFKTIIYEPYVLFNDEKVIEVVKGMSEPYRIDCEFKEGKFELKKVEKPMILGIKAEEIEKYEAIEKAWGMKTKVRRKQYGR